MMIQREIDLSHVSDSFFLFGARGTGKSTFLEKQFQAKNPLWIDLLDPDEEDRYSRDPKTLEREILSLIENKAAPDWVIIDEIQKIPKLLDVVHRLIERHHVRFALSGSSARKLKRGHANLLGGRALLYALYPFSMHELGDRFHLEDCLNWGSLPKVFSQKSPKLKIASLRSYVQIYLKEEILVEQLVRNLPPFKNFLEVSAQMNAQRLNFEKIGRDVGIDNKTVQTYFEILEDTYLGIKLPAFHVSVRKSQLLQPKFYWFDLGVQRFLSGAIHSLLVPGTFEHGNAFESFVINEIVKYNAYRELDYRFSYLQTKNGPEIDLILSRGNKHIAIEIKSATRVDPIEVNTLAALAQDIPGIGKIFFLSQDPKSMVIGRVHCLPWWHFFQPKYWNQKL